MKINNVRVVATVNVNPKGWSTIKEYMRMRNHMSMTGDNFWPDIGSPDLVPPEIYSFLEQGREAHSAFEASVVSYDYPVNPSHSMDRRHALWALRKAGVRPPSTAETLWLACRTIITNEVIDIILKNGERRLAAAVPFHPEIPCFYYFGIGNRTRTGSFQKQPYNDGFPGWHRRMSSPEDLSNLFFWRDSTKGLGYNFPLLLGIKL